MAATKEDITRWFKEGKRQKATHMIVVCDTFDYDDYPVYVKKTEDVHEICKKYNGQNMQRIMEVYKLSMSMENQLSQERVFNY